jgi:hypothetical protein
MSYNVLVTDIEKRIDKISYQKIKILNNYSLNNIYSES